MVERAQVAVEFLALTALLVSVLIVFSIVSYYRTLEINDLKVAVAGESVCSVVASEVNAAIMVGDGYERSFLLPAYLGDGASYSPQVIGNERRVLVLFDKGGCQKPLLSSQVNGTLAQGVVNVVKNVGGVVYLNA